MKLSFATTALLCLAPAADAFVVAPPSLRTGVMASTRQQCATTMVAPSAAAAAVTRVLQSSVVPLIAAGGVAEPGTVDAPAWVLPVGAFTVILAAGVIPLLLKVCVCACCFHVDTDENNSVYACKHTKHTSTYGTQSPSALHVERQPAGGLTWGVV